MRAAVILNPKTKSAQDKINEVRLWCPGWNGKWIVVQEREIPYDKPGKWLRVIADHPYGGRFNRWVHPWNDDSFTVEAS